jgi:hypothetical protein
LLLPWMSSSGSNRFVESSNRQAVISRGFRSTMLTITYVYHGVARDRSNSEGAAGWLGWL